LANWGFGKRKENSVEFRPFPSEDEIVKVAADKNRKSEAELLDTATNNMLRALKNDMQKKEGRVDGDKLRKDGFSDRLISKLEQA